MKAEIKAFDNEEGKNVMPVNLPSEYKPEKGQIIDTTDGLYQVKGWIGTHIEWSFTNIELIVKEVR